MGTPRRLIEIDLPIKKMSENARKKEKKFPIDLMGTVLDQSTKMFEISRQAALKEIGKLVRLKVVSLKGKKRWAHYVLS